MMIDLETRGRMDTICRKFCKQGRIECSGSKCGIKESYFLLAIKDGSRIAEHFDCELCRGCELTHPIALERILFGIKPILQFQPS